ncbi:hypothetical protein HBI24_209930 [Parastagonospora nodorum]|nr:hypothetical protein HBH49_204880 [Parastagonospora nodorum]KAH4062820.1 hypothetical protein HBH50_202630 [Parastagonospora nodorum]KAH4081579.1 hypothetical protein HBH48_198270 [Parastagonospora nodorum]KAH4084496.1 hypothetical protein HBH46_213030 [Parastagonospora nodorum]KAH4190226.1 hypothetical protein HBI95_219390 [Parastagonospora nodorum]
MSMNTCNLFPTLRTQCGEPTVPPNHCTNTMACLDTTPLPISTPYSPNVYFISSQTHQHRSSPLFIATTFEPSLLSYPRQCRILNPLQEHQLHAVASTTTTPDDMEATPKLTPNPDMSETVMEGLTPIPTTAQEHQPHAASTTTTIPDDMTATPTLTPNPGMSETVMEEPIPDPTTAQTLAKKTWSKQDMICLAALIFCIPIHVCRHFGLDRDRFYDISLAIAGCVLIFATTIHFLDIPATRLNNMEPWLEVLRRNIPRATSVLESHFLAMLGRQLLLRLMFVVQYLVYIPNGPSWEALNVAMADWPVTRGFYNGYPWALFLIILLCITKDAWWKPTTMIFRRNIIEPYGRLCAFVTMALPLIQDTVRHNVDQACLAVRHNVNQACLAVRHNVNQACLAVRHSVHQACLAIREYAQAKWTSLCRRCSIVWDRACGYTRDIRSFGHASILRAWSSTRHISHAARWFAITTAGCTRAGCLTLWNLPARVRDAGGLQEFAVALKNGLVALDWLHVARIVLCAMVWPAFLCLAYMNDSSVCNTIGFAIACTTTVLVSQGPLHWTSSLALGEQDRAS